MNPYSSIMRKSNVTATTVKIENDLYDNFKVLGIRHKLTLQNFVEKCVHLYVDSGDFRSTVDNFTVPIISNTGSFSFATSSIF